MIDRNNITEALIPAFEDERYYLLICDCGFGKVDELRERYPDRVINCGIMEQATVGIAAGMAQAGLKPVIYSIAAFVVFRAFEQIRNDIVLMERNVKIIGQGSGDFFKKLGACHVTNNDDIKLLNIIGMPVFEGEGFDQWLASPNAGYIRV